MSFYTTALEKLLRQRPDGRYELLITYRRDTDYADYEARIEALEARNKALEQQIYRFSMMAGQYVDALDDLQRLKRLLQDHHIAY